MMRKARVTAFLAAAALWSSAAAPARAVVTLTQTDTELLYSADDNPDCEELSVTGDADLPANVVRLRVLVDGAEPPPTARIKWFLPKPAVGFLVADAAAGNGAAPAVDGFCCEFGNACVITKEQLPLYNQDTILWLPPTCDTLPKDTSRKFRGDQVRLKVKVFDGKRSLGKAKVTVGYGRTASVTLFADRDDGNGKSSVLSDIRPLFSARTDASGVTLPPLDTYEFQNGEGDRADSVSSCVIGSDFFDACTDDLIYENAGKFLAVVEQRFTDKSALCDNLNVRLGVCDLQTELELIRKPKKNTYRNDDTVEFRVRLKNKSADRNCGALLIGANVLSCTAELKAPGIEETETHQFDLQHCSETEDQPCTSDADCSCQECGESEFCLLQSHCSDTLRRPCQRNLDCSKTACPDCKEDETCIQVLDTPSITVPGGQALDILIENTLIQSLLPDVAKMKETWKVDVRNQDDDPTAEQRYKIKR